MTSLLQYNKIKHENEKVAELSALTRTSLVCGLVLAA